MRSISSSIRAATVRAGQEGVGTEGENEVSVAGFTFLIGHHAEHAATELGAAEHPRQ